MYLSIDLWDKRCGIAIYMQWIVIPKDIVKREKLIWELNKYIKEYEITTIVVGLPYDLYGKNLKQLQKTEKFIEKLSSIYAQIKIVGCDERFTSFEADETLSLLGIDSRRGNKDDLAAASILESYLQIEKNRRK